MVSLGVGWFINALTHVVVLPSHAELGIVRVELNTALLEQLLVLYLFDVLFQPSKHDATDGQQVLCELLDEMPFHSELTWLLPLWQCHDALFVSMHESSGLVAS